MNRPPIGQLQAVRGVGQVLRNTEGPKAPEIWLVAPARERKSARPNKTRSPTTKSWECFILSAANSNKTFNSEWTSCMRSSFSSAFGTDCKLTGHPGSSQCTCALISPFRLTICLRVVRRRQSAFEARNPLSCTCTCTHPQIILTQSSVLSFQYSVWSRTHT
jgi:hypothetical protein